MELLTPDKPQGFAANANTLLENAIDDATDLIFLNNDIIFSPGWNIPLCSTNASILIPLCNQNLQYQHGDLKLKFLMDLADFIGREQNFLSIIEKHVADTSWRGFRKELHMSFFCFRLPYQISSVVGFFDEQFGRGGGEDVDYRIRTLLAGFDVQLAAESFVLHFMGKSTWRGGESQIETQRHESYRSYFRDKWGDDLGDLFLFGLQWRQRANELGINEMLESGNYRRIIEFCLALRSAREIATKLEL